MNSSACGSTEGSVNIYDSSTQKSLAFWELGTRPDITNTRTLVQVFNKATESNERQLLRLWLQGYNEWLIEPISLEDEDAEVLVHLFDLEYKSKEDQSVYKSLLCNLCRKVTQDTLFPTNLMKALDYALNKVDKSLLKDDTVFLLSLVDHLLGYRLARRPFTKDIYEIYSATLFALYQTAELLKKISSNPLSASKYAEINTRLKEIESSQEYYPIAYHAKLIRNAMKKLATGDTVWGTVNAGRRAFYAAVGGLYFTQTMSALAHLNLDIDAFKSAIENLKKSIPDVSGRWSMSNLEKRLELIFQATEKTLKENDFTHFKECYDAMMKRLRTAILKRSTWTMLRYCMVTQLRLIALAASSSRVRQAAIEELVSWGNRCSITKWSTESRHIFEALLESLHLIHKREKTDQLGRVITSMTKTATDRFRVIVNEWLGSNTLEDKLRQDPMPEIEDDRLYFKIRNKLGLSLTHEDVQSNIEDMKATYRADSFAEAFVSMVLEGDRKKHVKDFKHHIVCCSDVVLEKESTQNFFEDDHFAEDSKRKARKKESVDLRDLFRSRALDSDPSVKSVERVLLLGLPGTGKTSISKSFAYRWALEEITRDFVSVYVVPVRNLTREVTQSVRCEDILVVTIVRFCFSRSRTEEAYKALTNQIQIDLMKPSTLLIVDGLDEGDDDGKAIVERMLQFKCALLFTSRPYHLADVRKRVDVEMECLGLNDVQVIDFVHDALPESWASRMIQFLINHVSIWETAHIPVNLHIFCSLWKEKEEEGDQGPLRTKEESLYSQMIHLIWRRFVEKSKSQLNKSEVLETLERIAFEAQSRRKALIEPRIVQNHIRGPLPSKVFRDAGFLLLKKEGGFYQFPHLSFQENLAGKRLARLLLLSTPDEKEEAKRLISKMEYDEVHSVTLSFMVREAFFMRNEALEIILSAVDEGQRDVVGLRHIILKLRLVEAYFSIFKAKHGTLPFDRYIDILKTGTKLFRACQENDALTEFLFKKFLQFPNVLRIISTSLPNEMKWIACVAFRTLDPELSARFIKISQKELENFLENIDNEDQTLSNEHRINVLAYLPLEHFVKQASSKRDRIVNFLVARYLDKQYQIVDTSKELLGRCIGSFPDTVFVIDDALRARTSQSQLPDSMDFCFQSLKENCASSDAAIRFLSLKCGHETVPVRQRALTHVSDFARLSPKHLTAHLDVLTLASKDVSPTVRENAILQFGEIAKLFPKRSGEIWTRITDLVETAETEIRRTVVEKLPELVTMLPNDGRRVWELFRRCCAHSDVRKDAVYRLAEVAKANPKHLLEAWELLSKCCHDEDENVQIVAIDHLADFAAHFPKYKGKASALLSEFGREESENIQDMTMRQNENMSRTSLEQRSTNNSGTPLDSLQIPSSSSSEVVNSPILSEPEKSIEPENGTRKEKIDSFSTLSDACSDLSVDVRSQAIEKIERFANQSFENPPAACNLLCTLCEDNNVSVRQKAFDLLIKLSKLGPQNNLLPVSRSLELAHDVGTDHAMFLAIETAAELLETEREEEALDVLFKAALDRVKARRSKALECLERISLQKLLDVIRTSNMQKGLNVLVERLLTTTYITFDSNCPDEGQFVIVEIKGASETKTSLPDGKILVKALRECISVEYPELFDVLSPFYLNLDDGSSSGMSKSR